MIKLRVRELVEERKLTVQIGHQSGNPQTVPVDNASRLGALLGIKSGDVFRPLWTGEALDAKGNSLGRPPDRIGLMTLEKIIVGLGLDPATTTLDELFDFPENGQRKGRKAKAGKPSEQTGRTKNRAGWDLPPGDAAAKSARLKRAAAKKKKAE